MRKRLLSTLLALCMVLTLLPETALAAEIIASGNCGENATWTLDRDGTLTISGTGKMDDYYYGHSGPWGKSFTRLVIEEGITSIGLSAFRDCSSLTEPLIIPSSVTSIRGDAFSGCTGLTGIKDFGGITSIESQAFYDCSGLTGTLVIPGSVASIESNTFSGCSGLTGLVLQDGVTSIEREAFSRCSGLTSVSIPDTVTSIEGGAFSRCDLLVEITVGTGNSAYASDADGILFSKDMKELLWCPMGAEIESYAIPNTVTSIEDFAFEECTGLTGTLTIPSSVTSIGDYAFDGCTGLTGTLTIPSSVTSIGQGAFFETGFTGSVSISKYVTSIGSQVFAHCTGLTAIDVDSDNPVYTSEDGCLFNKAITELLCVPSGKVKDNYEIPSTVNSIADCAFQGCQGLTGILDIPQGVTSIGGVGFDSCSGLTGIRIPDTVATIEGGAFWGCDLTEFIVVENNPTYAAENGVLFNKNFSELISYPIGNTKDSYEIPDTVSTIKYGAFVSCTHLTSISIPDSVTSIEDYAFEFCDGLKDVYYAGSEDQWNRISIGDDGNESLRNARVYYNTFGPPAPITGICGNNLTWTLAKGTLDIQGEGDMENYDNSDTSVLSLPPWYDYREHIETIKISPGVTSIGIRAFSGCSYLTSVDIPESVSGIGWGAFLDCSSLTSVTIPTGVTSIAPGAFLGCTSLTSVTIPTGVTSIGSNAFYSCTTLTEVTIPNSVTSIRKEAFTGCTSLTSITIENPSVEIEAEAIGTMYDDNGTILPIPGVTIYSYSGSTAQSYADSYDNIAFVTLDPISGTCGENLTWTLAKGTLLIQGAGNMEDYAISGRAISSSPPWYDYRKQIKTIKIGSGVTSIGEAAFSGCSNLTSVAIPATVDVMLSAT